MKTKVMDRLVEVGAWAGSVLFFFLVVKIITEII